MDSGLLAIDTSWKAPWSSMNRAGLCGIQGPILQQTHVHNSKKLTRPPTIDTTKLLTSSRSGPPLSFGRLQASFTPVPTNRCTASGRKSAADFGLCTGCSRSGSQLLPLRIGRWSSTGGPGSIGALDREPISHGGPHSWGHAQKLGTNMRRNMKET